MERLGRSGQVVRWLGLGVAGTAVLGRCSTDLLTCLTGEICLSWLERVSLAQMYALLFATLLVSIGALIDRTLSAQKISKGITKRGRHFIGPLRTLCSISMATRWPVYPISFSRMQQHRLRGSQSPPFVLRQTPVKRQCYAASGWLLESTTSIGRLDASMLHSSLALLQPLP